MDANEAIELNEQFEKLSQEVNKDIDEWCSLVLRAYQEKVWKYCEVKNWQEYCHKYVPYIPGLAIGQRRPTVEFMEEQGMTRRAIAYAFHCSPQTITNDMLADLKAAGVDTTTGTKPDAETTATKPEWTPPSPDEATGMKLDEDGPALITGLSTLADDLAALSVTVGKLVAEYGEERPVEYALTPVGQAAAEARQAIANLQDDLYRLDSTLGNYETNLVNIFRAVMNRDPSSPEELDHFTPPIIEAGPIRGDEDDVNRAAALLDPDRHMTEIEAVRLTHQLLSEHGHGDWGVKISTRARNWAGRTSYNSKTVRLARHWLTRHSYGEAFNTVTHEVAHVIAGHEHAHDMEWSKIHKSLGGDGRATFHDDEDEDDAA